MTWWANFSRRHSNWPNALSLLRALLGLMLPFLLLAAHPHFHVAAGILFIAGALTDYWDGWIARRQGLVSNLGKILDPTADKILILCPLATFAFMGYFSAWWLVPIFAREIMVTFCRIGWLLEAKAAAAEILGKIKLAVQVVMVVSPFAELMSRDFAALSGFQPFFDRSTLWLLILGNVLTLFSGFTFLRKNRDLFRAPGFAKFVSACGVGLLPGTPGTYGSLLAMPLLPFLAWSPALYGGVFAFLFWAGYWAVKRLDLSVIKDPQFVVIDEVLGILITFAFIPLTPLNLIAGFFLFRFFDILKPFPCRRLERLPGFWGIALDDAGAGIYARLALHLFQ